MTKPVFDDQMNLIGWTDDDGTFVAASSGRVESRTGPDGTAYDPEGNRLGWGDRHGTVMDPSGNIAGWSPDGMVVGSSGHQGWVGSHADPSGHGSPDRTRDAGAIVRLSDHRPGQPYERPAPHDTHEAGDPGSRGPVSRSSVDRSHYEPVGDDEGLDEVFLVFDDDLPERSHSHGALHVIHCLHCGGRISVAASKQPMRLQCPLCRGQFTYP